jgi:hypothetical protein
MNGHEMARPLYFLIALIFSTTCAQANLGETVAQVVERYGKPTGFAEANAKTPFGSLLFKAGGYELIIFILDGKEVGARVSKADKSAFTDAEMQSILSADSDGAPWKSAPSDDPSSLQWTRDDQATVLYDKDKRMLIFTSEAMSKAFENQKAKVGN